MPHVKLPTSLTCRRRKATPGRRTAPTRTPTKLVMGMLAGRAMPTAAWGRRCRAYGRGQVATVRTRALVYSFVAMVLIAVLSVGRDRPLTGKSPLLGLDLKGGVSVTERPTGAVTSNILQEAVDIMDRRVDGTGVSNSSVAVQGGDIVIELPGAKNDTQVLSFLGETAQLFFRPLIHNPGALRAAFDLHRLYVDGHDYHRPW